MRDKPQPGADPVFALPDHRVVDLHGRDASGFAQAQFMSDVNALAAGHWHWSGWLTPKGRVLAVFAVVKLSDERLWLLLPDTAPAAFASALQRYVFRSKVAIAMRDDLQVCGAFAAPQVASGAGVSRSDDDTAVELDMGGAGGPRRLHIGRGGGEQKEHGSARWAAFDLEHGFARLPESQLDHWTPQQLSLERLDAFSIKKGCYPGQEIVARTHFLGKAKRGLALVESDRPMTAGAQLRRTGGDSVLGTLVAAASAAADRHLALAVVPLERDAGALSVDGIAVREAPLREGLAR